MIKQINLINQYPKITNLIQRDLQEISSKPIQDFRLIQAKGGVYVYKCLYNSTPAIAKYFEEEDGRREISNYRILEQYGIPTIKTYALGKASFIMEDISFSKNWRLGIAQDLADIDVAQSLAHWYFTLHEIGSNVSEINTLFFEFAKITVENLQMLLKKLPEAQELFEFLINNFDKFYEIIFLPTFTITYNDFYWTNLIVSKDKKSAMMFDYNFMGKGYRLSDLQNVCWSMSDDAKKTFKNEYNRQYLEKYKINRTKEESFEKSIDDVAGAVYALIIAYTANKEFPDWANNNKKEAIDGSLLYKSKRLLDITNIN